MSIDNPSDSSSDSHSNRIDAVDLTSIDSIKDHDWSDFDLREAERGVEKPYFKPDVLAYLYWIVDETQEQIGQRYGVTDGTIRYHMRKHSVPRETDPSDFSATINYAFEGARDNTYSWVWSCLDSERYDAYVHQIAACTENDPHEVFGNGTEVDHVTGHPLDNRPEALEVLEKADHRKRHSGETKWVIEDGEPRHYAAREAPEDAEDPLEEWHDEVDPEWVESLDRSR
jgi:hypothetical protein